MPDITLTAAGQDHAVSSGDLYLPYRGNWTSHLDFADVITPPTGRVTLSFHGLSLTGYVLRSGESEGQVSAIVVGGYGGLWKQIQAKYYDHQLALRLPLQEIVSATGERLSPTSTASVLSRTLNCWPRRQDLAGTLLDTLASSADALWRVLPDGSIFFGTDTWSSSAYTEDKDYTVLARWPEWSMVELAPLTRLGVLPGQTLNGARVGRIHLEDDGESYTARIWHLGADGAADDPVVAGLRGLIKEELGGLPYLPAGQGKVVQQRADGSLDVQMDDRRLPPLTSVPYLVPVPGAKLTVQPGSQVQVCFAGGDPMAPQAMLYGAGQGTKAIGIDGDQVNAGTLVLTVSGGGASPAVLAGTYTDPFGTVTTVASGVPIPLKGKLIGSAPLKLP